MSEITETSTSRVAILTKDQHYAVIALDTNVSVMGSTVHVVSNNDPRAKPPMFYNSFATPSEAVNAFNEALATSRDRGWTVAHVGPRHVGQQ